MRTKSPRNPKPSKHYHHTSELVWRQLEWLTIKISSRAKTTQLLLLQCYLLFLFAFLGRTYEWDSESEYYSYFSIIMRHFGDYIIIIFWLHIELNTSLKKIKEINTNIQVGQRDQQRKNMRVALDLKTYCALIKIF